MPSRIPLKPTELALFIAYLFKQKYAASTVSTYVSALGFYHRLAGFIDPTKMPFVVQMLKGYSKICSRIDTRLPITLPILERIVSSATLVCAGDYQTALFKAMCLLAFYAFLRVGEFTVSKGGMQNILQVSQLTRLISHGSVIALKVTFLQYKHHVNDRPYSIIVKRQEGGLCPVKEVLSYLILHFEALFLVHYS